MFMKKTEEVKNRKAAGSGNIDRDRDFDPVDLAIMHCLGVDEYSVLKNHRNRTD